MILDFIIWIKLIYHGTLLWYKTELKFEPSIFLKKTKNLNNVYSYFSTITIQNIF
jgi:hypothetical protein